MKDNVIRTTVDYPLKRSGFDVGNNPEHTANLMPENFLSRIVYAHLDFDALGEEEKTRPYQLALGVAEHWQNLEYIYKLSANLILPPKEIFLYSQATSGVTLATRKLSNIRLRNSSISYSKLPGGDKEMMIHRLVFNCYQRDIELPFAPQ